ncbi:MAG: C-GCAxxG-C-C family (seleno)protein [Candidatus Izemoplasmatales bacterium]
MNPLIKKYYLEENYNCAETILLLAKDEYNLPINSDYVKMMSGFGGGMYEEDVCGVVTGGIAVLSLIYQTDMLKEAVTEFRKNIKLSLSSLTCKEIKPIHRDEIFRCNNVIDKAFIILKEVINNKEKARF